VNPVTDAYQWLREAARREPLLPVLLMLLLALSASYHGFATAANFRNIAIQAAH